MGKLTSFPLSGCNPENELENIFCFLVCMENHHSLLLFQMVIWTKTFVHNMKVFGFGTVAALVLRAENGNVFHPKPIVFH